MKSANTNLTTRAELLIYFAIAIVAAMFIAISGTLIMLTITKQDRALQQQIANGCWGSKPTAKQGVKK